MYFLIILIIADLPFTVRAVNDTPGGNIPFEVNYFPGACVDVPSRLFSCDNKEAYEGRWYVTHTTFTANFVRNLSCFTWDLFFSTGGVFHDFLYTLYNEEVKTFVSRLTPIPGKIGEFTQDDGISPKGSIRVTLYYVDTEMIVYWDQNCTESSKHSRNVVVGYRDQFMIRDKQPQLDRVMKTLEKISGGPLTLHPIRHNKNCRYPPKMANPYAETQ